MAIMKQQEDHPAATAAPRNKYAAYGFSGNTVTVEFLNTKDNEPRDIFVGVGDYQARIKRGTKVTIPVEVFRVLERATYTEEDDDPEHEGRKMWVEKHRYPFNVLSRS